MTNKHDAKLKILEIERDSLFDKRDRVSKVGSMLLKLMFAIILLNIVINDFIFNILTLICSLVTLSVNIYSYILSSKSLKIVEKIRSIHEERVNELLMRMEEGANGEK